MPDDYTFTLTAAMRQRVVDWYRNPFGEHRCEPDSFDGLMTYSFTPCGIGDSIKVTCPCGLSLDLTDVDTW